MDVSFWGKHSIVTLISSLSLPQLLSTANRSSLTNVQTVLINRSKHKDLKDSLTACIFYKTTVVHVPTKAYDLPQSWSLDQVCHTKHDFPSLE